MKKTFGKWIVYCCAFSIALLVCVSCSDQYTQFEKEEIIPPYITGYSPVPSEIQCIDGNGNAYSVVNVGIGTLFCVMSENLKCTKYSDGTEIAKNDMKELPDGSIMYSFKAIAKLAVNPMYYNEWIDYQGIAPDGWYIPSLNDWQDIAKSTTQNTGILNLAYLNMNNNPLVVETVPTDSIFTYFATSSVGSGNSFLTRIGIRAVNKDKMFVSDGDIIWNGDQSLYYSYVRCIKKEISSEILKCFTSQIYFGDLYYNTNPNAGPVITSDSTISVIVYFANSSGSTIELTLPDYLTAQLSSTTPAGNVQIDLTFKPTKAPYRLEGNVIIKAGNLSHTIAVSGTSYAPLNVTDFDGNTYAVLDLSDGDDLLYFTKTSMVAEHYSDGTSIDANYWGRATTPENNLFYKYAYSAFVGMAGLTDGHSDPAKVNTFNDFSNMQGPCPDGWRIPRQSDWEKVLARGVDLQSLNMTDAVDGESASGTFVPPDFNNGDGSWTGWAVADENPNDNMKAIHLEYTPGNAAPNFNNWTSKATNPDNPWGFVSVRCIRTTPLSK